MAKRPDQQSNLDQTKQFVRDSQTANVSSDQPSTVQGPELSDPPLEATGLPKIRGYQVEAELGRGGNGVVYRAFDTRLKRLVALKMLLSGADATDEQLARFRTEAESVARLQHAGIVQIFDVGNHNGLPYLTLEFVDGRDLKSFSKHQPLAPRVAASIVEDIARAIGFAHENGVIHRDLKPGNILIPSGQTAAASPTSTVAINSETAVVSVANPTDATSTAFSSSASHQEKTDKSRLLRVTTQAKVADFGLAKQLDVDHGHTQTGNVLGTAAYMSPEQASAQSNVGPATDIYSMGAILYFLLTGSVPFRGATLMQTLKMVVTTEPIAPRRLVPDLDADIDTICLRCMEKEPGRRYQSAYSLADDLARYLAGQPIHARPLGSFERAVRWTRRSPAFAALIALVLFLAIAGPVTAVYQMRLSRDLLSAQTERAKADQQKLDARVEMLLTTELRNFPVRMEALADDQAQVSRKLSGVWKLETLNPDQRLRVALALLSSDVSTREYLESRLMNLPDTELLVATQLITRHCSTDQSAANHWIDFAKTYLDSQQADVAQRATATCLLAQLDSDHIITSEPVGVARWLCGKSEPNLSHFASLLAPVAARLIPQLQQLFHEGSDQTERVGAAIVLGVYLADQPATVAELFLNADAPQFNALRVQAGDQLSQYRNAFELALDERPQTEAPDKSTINRRRANAGVGLVLCGEPQTVWPHLKHSNDPELRSHLLHRLSALGVEPAVLIDALQEHDDVTIKRALVLAIGEYPVGEFSQRQLDQLITQLLALDLSDSGLRGAVRWALNQFQRANELPELPILAGMDAADTKEPMFQTSTGIEMTVIPAYRGFHVGSPQYESARVSTNEDYRAVRIDRTFAISTTEITHEVFEEFLAEHPTLRHVGPESFQIQPHYPESRMSWYRAIAFCQWLNERERIPESEWCFQRNLKGNFGHDMELTWDALDRCGYRLPTEAEWEFACRSGTDTARHYGDDNSLLRKYAWYSNYSDGRTHDVGQLKPNDFGLFDMLGNVSEYCFDQTESFNSRSVSDEQKLFFSSIMRSSTHVTYRGASQYAGGPALRSAVRFYASSANNAYRSGFRAVRTIRSPRDVEVVRERLNREPRNLQLAGRYFKLLCRDGHTSMATQEYRRFEEELYPQDTGILLTGNGDSLEFTNIPFDDYDQFTIEAWVRDWKGALCNQGRYWDPENSIWLNLPSTAGWESGEGRDHYQLENKLTVANEWTHLALVFDGSTRRVFHNGRLILTEKNNQVGPFKQNRSFQIGAMRGRFDVGRGLLGSLRVSKVARYTKQFSPARELIEDEATQLFVHPSRVRGNQIIDDDGNKVGHFVHAPWTQTTDDPADQQQ